MIELEYKSKIGDPSSIQSKLLELGAEFRGEFRELDVYYQHPSREFRDEALRLRFSPNPELCYKSPRLKSKFKARWEFKLPLSNSQARAMHAILSKLGFRIYARVDKLRREYRIQDLRICLDDVKHLGWFVELELMAPTSQLESWESRMHEFLKELGLDPDQSIKKSYLELLLGI